MFWSCEICWSQTEAAGQEQEQYFEQLAPSPDPLLEERAFRNLLGYLQQLNSPQHASGGHLYLLPNQEQATAIASNLQVTNGGGRLWAKRVMLKVTHPGCHFCGVLCGIFDPYARLARYTLIPVTALLVCHSFPFNFLLNLLLYILSQTLSISRHSSILQCIRKS